MEVSRGSSIEKLPNELKLKIMEYLSGNNLVQLELVTSEWRDLIRNSDHLWEKMCYKIMEMLPECLKLKELPPEGLNWKELFALWTVLLRNMSRFRRSFRKRDVYTLDLLFYQAIPRRRPVRYYVEFGSPSFDTEIFDEDSEDSKPESENSVNNACCNIDTSDSDCSDYHCRQDQTEPLPVSFTSTH